jgi:hypothetical protein
MGADEVVGDLEENRDRAIAGLVAANPDLDEPEDWREIYDELSPIDEEGTHTVELELNDYEILHLHAKLLPTRGDGHLPADQILLGTAILAQIIEQAPDHVEHIRQGAVQHDDLTSERGVY